MWSQIDPAPLAAGSLEDPTPCVGATRCRLASGERAPGLDEHTDHLIAWAVRSATRGCHVVVVDRELVDPEAHLQPYGDRPALIDHRFGGVVGQRYEASDLLAGRRYRIAGELPHRAQVLLGEI